MTTPRADHPDLERSRLRGLVAAIERNLHEGGSPPASLEESWTALVKALALGTEPEVRECPVCKHLAMSAATRCSNCWSKLSPLV
jgi:hypothetical protein